MKKETKVQLIIIVILSIILSVLLFVIFKDNNRNNMFIPMEEEVEKETSKDDVDNGDTINEENINLNNYESNSIFYVGRMFLYVDVLYSKTTTTS